jgi:hypothetical protein
LLSALDLEETLVVVIVVIVVVVVVVVVVGDLDVEVLVRPSLGHLEAGLHGAAVSYVVGYRDCVGVGAG